MSAIEIDAQTTTHIDLNFEIKVNVSVQRNIINIMIVIKLNGSARIAHTHSSAHGESYDFDFNTIGIYAVQTSTRQTFFFVCCYLLLVFCYLLQYFIQIWCTCVFDHTWSYADAFKDAIETFNGKKNKRIFMFSRCSISLTEFNAANCSKREKISIFREQQSVLTQLQRLFHCISN